MIGSAGTGDGESRCEGDMRCFCRCRGAGARRGICSVHWVLCVVCCACFLSGSADPRGAIGGTGTNADCIVICTKAGPRPSAAPSQPPNAGPSYALVMGSCRTHRRTGIRKDRSTQPKCVNQHYRQRMLLSCTSAGWSRSSLQQDNRIEYRVCGAVGGSGGWHGLCTPVHVPLLPVVPHLRVLLCFAGRIFTGTPFRVPWFSLTPPPVIPALPYNLS